MSQTQYPRLLEDRIILTAEKVFAKIKKVYSWRKVFSAFSAPICLLVHKRLGKLFSDCTTLFSSAKSFISQQPDSSVKIILSSRSHLGGWLSFSNRAQESPTELCSDFGGVIVVLDSAIASSKKGSN